MPKRQNERTPSKEITQQQTYAEIQVTEFGTLSFRVTKRTQALPATAKDARQRETRHLDRTMVITFMPYDPRKFNMIVASTLQRDYWGDATPSISRLDVNRVLPRNSPVFETVRRGHLQELREMLQNGEASLRDHDEFGANLLMYSTNEHELCKFLLSTNTFDLDHVGGDAGVMYRKESYLSSVLDLCSPERGRSIGKCSRLLLEAGVDPTIRIGGRTFLERMSTHGSNKSIRAFWDLALRCYFESNFIDAKTAASQALLAACWDLQFYFTENISLFLELGADITMRDSLGRSCLHICFRHLRHLDVITLDGVIHLLNNGADPYARDNEGVSVSEVAYENRSLYSRNYMGSMLGDIWDYALHSCGYDIAEFRRHHQRKAGYTSYYGRRDFVSLWHDKIYECPYWDDAPWPQLSLWQLPEFEYSDEEVDEEANKETDEEVVNSFVEETEEDIDCERDYRSDSIVSWLATITTNPTERENVVELAGDG
ncbi:hypothetical protein F5Y09DRAFT_337237 [Xylaria sp. FL1042]|nr:hypothetical protein F5Y09DRAFT_337237 [Xylaria sp. FL1042]